MLLSGVNTIHVTTGMDGLNPYDFETSLREAVVEANANGPGLDVIQFSLPPGGLLAELIYDDPLVINTDLELRGPTDGTHVTVARASNPIVTPATRIFEVAAGRNVSMSDLTLTNGYLANGDGAGIHNSGNLTLNSVNVVDNYTTGGSGGGIFNAATGTLTINSSAIANNSASGAGGGLVNDGGVVVIDSSTFSGNQSATDGSAILNTGALDIVSSTIVYNDSGSGAAIQSSQTVISNSIVALNTGGADVEGAFTSGGHNLIDDAGQVVFSGPNDQVGTAGTGIDPILGQLQNNGGGSFSHQLLPGSPAIDAGASLAEFDQRGAPRLLDGLDPLDLADSVKTPDIGAFEFGALFVNVKLDAVDSTILADGRVDSDTSTAFDQVTLRGAVQELSALAGSNNAVGTASGIFDGVILFEKYIGQVDLTIAGTDDNLSLTGDLDVYGKITVMGDERVPTSIPGSDEVVPDLPVNIIGARLHWEDYSGGYGDRLFHVQDGSFLSFERMSLVGGYSVVGADSIDAGFGGLILNDGGTLHVNDSSLGDPYFPVALAGAGAIADLKGGGVYSRNGEVIVDNSFIGLVEADAGGGIYLESGTLKIGGGSFIHSNSAINGGAIYIESGDVAIGEYTRLVSNNALYEGSLGTGGGIYQAGGQLLLNGGSVLRHNDGGVYIADGVAEIRDVVSSANGMGIYNNGVVGIYNTTVSGGRGVVNDSHAIMNIYDSVFSGNGGLQGAAIHNDNGVVNVYRSLFKENVALLTADDGVSEGGAIYNNDLDAVLNVVDSLFHFNHGDASGGAITNHSGTVNISGSTFAHNWTAAIGAQGGAVFNDATNVLLNEALTFETLLPVTTTQTTIDVTISDLTQLTLPVIIRVGAEQMLLTAVEQLSDRHRLTVVRAENETDAREHEDEVTGEYVMVTSSDQTEFEVRDVAPLLRYHLPFDILLKGGLTNHGAGEMDEVVTVTAIDEDVLTVIRQRYNSHSVDWAGSHIDGVSGSTTISGSTFSDNHNGLIGADGFGGGLANVVGRYVQPTVVENSTFFRNDSFVGANIYTYSEHAEKRLPGEPIREELYLQNTVVSEGRLPVNYGNVGTGRLTGNMVRADAVKDVFGVVGSGGSNFVDISHDPVYVTEAIDSSQETIFLTQAPDSLPATILVNGVEQMVVLNEGQVIVDGQSRTFYAVERGANGTVAVDHAEGVLAIIDGLYDPSDRTGTVEFPLDSMLGPLQVNEISYGKDLDHDGVISYADFGEHNDAFVDYVGTRILSHAVLPGSPLIDTGSRSGVHGFASSVYELTADYEDRYLLVDDVSGFPTHAPFKALLGSEWIFVRSVDAETRTLFIDRGAFGSEPQDHYSGAYLSYDFAGRLTTLFETVTSNTVTELQIGLMDLPPVPFEIRVGNEDMEVTQVSQVTQHAGTGEQVDALTLSVIRGVNGTEAAHNYVAGSHVRVITDQQIGLRSTASVANQPVTDIGAIETTIFDVNTLDDLVDLVPGDGRVNTETGEISLRAAIMEANNSTRAATIVLPAGHFSLTLDGIDEDDGATGDLDIHRTIRIVGMGAELTSIDAASLDRVFDLFPGAVLTISDVTILGGNVVGEGGAIRSQDATVRIFNSHVLDNSATDGGAVNVEGGSVEIQSSTLSGNDASQAGGAIFASNSLVKLYTATISGNDAGTAGGGIYTDAATHVILSSSTISDNDSPTAPGVHNGGTATIANTIIAGNSASTGFGFGAAKPDIFGAWQSDGGNLIGVRPQGRALAVHAIPFYGRIRLDSHDDLPAFPFEIEIGGTEQVLVIGESDGDLIVERGQNGTGGANLDHPVGAEVRFDGFWQPTWLANDLVGTELAPIDPGLAPLGLNNSPIPTQALQNGSPAIDAGDSDDFLGTHTRLSAGVDKTYDRIWVEDTSMLPPVPFIVQVGGEQMLVIERSGRVLHLEVDDETGVRLAQNDTASDWHNDGTTVSVFKDQRGAPRFYNDSGSNLLDVGAVEKLPGIFVERVDAVRLEGDTFVDPTTQFQFKISTSDMPLAFFDVDYEIVPTGDRSVMSTDFPRDADGYPIYPSGTVSLSGASQTFTIDVRGDLALETNETFRIVLKNATTDAVIANSAIGTVLNDDAVNVSIGDIRRYEYGDGEDRVFNFKVRLDRPVKDGFTLPFYTVDGSATAADGDYQATSGYLTFLGELGETHEINVVVYGDDVVEMNEKFEVHLGQPGANDLRILNLINVADSYGLGTILNTDQAMLSIAHVEMVEGDEGQSRIAFDITLNNELDVPLNVKAVTESITASAGEDYRHHEETLYFDGTAGETRRVYVDVFGDVVDEYDETFELQFEDLEAFGRESRITLAPGIGTILTDDIPGFEVTPITMHETDSGDVVYDFAVQLNLPEGESNLSGPVTITVETVDETAFADAPLVQNDYVYKSEQMTFSGTHGESQTFSVVVHGDETVELNELFNVEVSNIQPGGTEQFFNVRNGQGIILNDDLATLNVSDATMNEGGTATFSVSLSHRVDVPFAVDVLLTSDTATVGSDFVESNATLNFDGNANETQTFTVASTEDSMVELSESFGISLEFDAQARNVVGGTGSGTITDNDIATITVGDVDGYEADGLMEFTLTLDNPVQLPVGELITAAVQIQPGTANSGDYIVPDTEQGLSVSFTGTQGETDSVTLLLVNDGLFENGETVYLAITSITTGGFNVVAGSPGTGTIHDGSGDQGGTGGGGTGGGGTGGGDGTGGDSGGTGDGGTGDGGIGGNGSGGDDGGYGSNGNGSGTGGDDGGSSGDGGLGGGGGDDNGGEREPWCLTADDENEDNKCDGKYVPPGDDGGGDGEDDDEGEDEDEDGDEDNDDGSDEEEEEDESDDDLGTGNCTIEHSALDFNGFGSGLGGTDFTAHEYEVSHTSNLTFNPIDRFAVPDSVPLTQFPDLEYSVSGDGKYGDVSVNDDSTLTYRPHAGLTTRVSGHQLQPEKDSNGRIVRFTGADTFVVNLSLNGESIAEVPVTIAATNSLPVFIGDRIHDPGANGFDLDGYIYTDFGTTDRIDMQDLFFDPDGDSFSIAGLMRGTNFATGHDVKIGAIQDRHHVLGLFEFWETEPENERFLKVLKSGNTTIDVYNNVDAADTDQPHVDKRWSTTGYASMADIGIVMTDGQIGTDGLPTSWTVNLSAKPRHEKFRTMWPAPEIETRSWVTSLEGEPCKLASHWDVEPIIPQNGRQFEVVGNATVDVYNGSLVRTHGLVLDGSGGASELSLPGLIYDSSTIHRTPRSSGDGGGGQDDGNSGGDRGAGFEVEGAGGAAGLFVRAVVNGDVEKLSGIGAKLTWYDHVNPNADGTPREYVSNGSFEIQEHSGGKAIIGVRPQVSPLLPGVYRWKLDVTLSQLTDDAAGNSITKTATISTHGETVVVVEQSVSPSDFEEDAPAKFDRTTAFGAGFKLEGVPSVYLDERSEAYGDDRLILAFPGQSPSVFDLRPLSGSNWTYDGPLPAIQVGADSDSNNGQPGFDDIHQYGSLTTRNAGEEMVYRTGGGVEYIFRKFTNLLPRAGSEVHLTGYFIDRIEQPGLDFDPASPSVRRGVSFERTTSPETYADAERILKIVASDGTKIEFEYSDDHGRVEAIHQLSPGGGRIRTVELKYNKGTLEAIVHKNSLADGTDLPDAIRSFGYAAGLMTNDSWWEQPTNEDDGSYGKKVRETHFEYKNGMVSQVIQGSKTGANALGAGPESQTGGRILTKVWPASLAGIGLKAGRSLDMKARVAVAVDYESYGENNKNQNAGSSDGATPHLATDYFFTADGQLNSVKQLHLLHKGDERELVGSEGSVHTLSLQEFVLDATGAIKIHRANAANDLPAIPGINASSAAKLKAAGIKTIAGLARISAEKKTELEPEFSQAEINDWVKKAKLIVDGVGGRESYFRYDYELPAGTTGYSAATYRGNVLQTVTNSGKTESTYELNANKLVGSLVETVSDGGLTTYFNRADDGQLKVLTTAGSNNQFSSESWTYASNGLLETHTGVLGLLTTYAYVDNSTRIDTVTVANQFDDAVTTTVDTYSYDQLGTVASVTHKMNGALLGTDKTIFDALGYARFTETLGFDNQSLAKSSVQFSPDGFRTRTIDGVGTVFESDYDSSGLLTRQVAGVGAKHDSKWLDKELSLEQETTFSYYSDGTLKTVSSADDTQTRYYLDPVGKLQTTVVTGLFGGSATAGSGAVTISRTGAEVVQTQTDALGRVVKLENLNLMAETVYAYEDARTNQPTQVTSDYAKSHLTAGHGGAGEKLKQQFVFDGSGHVVVSLTSDTYDGRALPATTFKYDSYGGVTQQKTHAEYGSILTFVNNAYGNPIEATELRRGPNAGPQSIKTTLRYDEAGSLKETIDALNVQGDAPASAETGTVAAGTYESVSDGLVKITHRTRTGIESFDWYDAAGNLVKTQSALGGITRFEYDKVGNQTKAIGKAYVTDASGSIVEKDSVSTVVYDSLGRVRSVTQSGDGKSITTWSDYFLPSDTKIGWTNATIDADENTYVSIIDSAGRTGVSVSPTINLNAGGLKEEDGPDNREDTFAGSQVTLYNYAFLSAASVVSTVQTVTDGLVTPNGFSVRPDYDNARYRRQTVSQSGSALQSSSRSGDINWELTQVASVDAFGRVVTTRSGADTASDTIYTYDDAKSGTGQVLRVRRPGAESVFFEYDSAGNKVKQSNRYNFPVDETQEWIYDQLGRVRVDTLKVDHFLPNGNHTVIDTTRTWDYQGLTTVFKDRNHQEITTVFNPATRTRIETASLPNGDVYTTTTTLHKNGQPLSVSEISLYAGSSLRSKATTSYEYDVLGRQTKETIDLQIGNHVVPTVTIDTTLNDNGQTTRLSHSIDGDLLGFTNYTFDAVGQPVAIFDNLATSQGSWWVDGSVAEDKYITFTYNADGQVATQKRWKGTPESHSSRGISTYDFRADGQVGSVVHEDLLSSPVAIYGAEFNSRGELENQNTTLFKADGSHFIRDLNHYEYYTDGQVKSVETDDLNNGDPAIKTTYVYDHRGNLETKEVGGETEIASSALLDNRIYTETIDGKTRNSTYDKEGRLLKRVQTTTTASQAGTFSTVDSEEFDWDHRGRLIAVRERHSNLHNGQLSNSSMTEVHYFYDATGRRIGRHDVTNDEYTAYIYDSSGLVYELAIAADSQVKIQRHYVNGPAGLIAVDQTSTDNTSTVWTYADKSGSITSLSRTFEQNNQTMVGRVHFKFDANGNVVETTGSDTFALEIPVSWRGMQFDPIGKVYLAGTTAVDPLTGRYISQAANDVNGYRFAGNTPSSQRVNSSEEVKDDLSAEYHSSVWEFIGESIRHGESVNYGEVGHLALDGLGMIPGIGFVFDAANSVWFAAEGRWAESAMSGLAAIPGIGQFATGAKYAGKGVKLGARIGKGVDAVKDVQKVASAGTKTLKAWKRIDTGVNVAMAGYAVQQGVQNGSGLQAGVGAFGVLVNGRAIGRAAKMAAQKTLRSAAKLSGDSSRFGKWVGTTLDCTAHSPTTRLSRAVRKSLGECFVAGTPVLVGTELVVDAAMTPAQEERSEHPTFGWIAAGAAGLVAAAVLTQDAERDSKRRSRANAPWSLLPVRPEIELDVVGVDFGEVCNELLMGRATATC